MTYVRACTPCSIAELQATLIVAANLFGDQPGDTIITMADGELTIECSP